MRSPNHVVISVRKADKSIAVKEKFYQNLTQRVRSLNIPIVRGVINLFEMMGIGFQAINFSANEFIEEEEDIKKRKSESGKSSIADNARPKSTAAKIGEVVMFLISLVLALGFSILLFKILPLWLTTLLETKFQIIKDQFVVFNIIDGLLKTTFFILYIFVLSLFPSFKRIFEYHGAEHQSVFTYEASLPLTVANARKQSRFHPRCGTSFILIVFVLSILVYTLIPRQPEFATNLLMRLALLPLIAGLAYEYLKLSARYANNKFTQIFVAPGLWLQRLTTKDPTDDQLEIALHSLKRALELEK